MSSVVSKSIYPPSRAFVEMLGNVTNPLTSGKTLRYRNSWRLFSLSGTLVDRTYTITLSYTDLDRKNWTGLPSHSESSITNIKLGIVVLVLRHRHILNRHSVVLIHCSVQEHHTHSALFRVSAPLSPRMQGQEGCRT